MSSTQTPTSGTPSASRLLILNAIFPGLGHLVAGKRRTALILALPVLVLIGIMVLALIVRWLALVAADQAEQSPVFVVGIYAVPVVSAAALLALIAANRPLDLPVGIVEKAGAAFGRLNELRAKAGMRMRGVVRGVHLERGDEIRIAGSRSNVILDGELFEANNERPIVLRPTPPVPFLRLAA